MTECTGCGCRVGLNNAGRCISCDQADRMAELKATVATQRELLINYRAAMEYTRQYVGYDTLPEIKGWSWYDADCAVKAHLESKDD